jgi:hypothetical protein
MILNTANLAYALPGSNPTELNNRPQTGLQPKTDTDKTNFPADAAILSLSPEALINSQLKDFPAGTGAIPPKTASGPENSQLNEAQQQIVRKLQMTDLHVKTHEQQHLSIAGSYAHGGASFQYVQGPDGKPYAVAGEIAIDVSPVTNNPQATIIKAQVIRRAALAPSDPSGADRSIAAAATQMEIQARAELTNQKTAEEKSNPETSNIQTGNTHNFYMKSYQKSLQLQPGTHFNKIA